MVVTAVAMPKTKTKGSSCRYWLQTKRNFQILSQYWLNISFYNIVLHTMQTYTDKYIHYSVGTADQLLLDNFCVLKKVGSCRKDRVWGYSL